MSQDPFELALRRRIENYMQAERRASARISEFESERQRLRDRRAAAELLYEAEYGSPNRSLTLTESGEGESDGAFTGKPWEDAIAEVLYDAGAALHVKEIWGRLAAGGFQTEAKDPLRSIVAVVLRSERFVRGGPNIYGLVNPGRAKGGEASLSQP